MSYARLPFAQQFHPRGLTFDDVARPGPRPRDLFRGSQDQDLLGNHALLAMMGLHRRQCQQADDTAPAPAPPAFSTDARGLFSAVDTDHDGEVSTQELDVALADPSFRGEDAATLAAWRENAQVVADSHNDDWFDPDEGTTEDDLDALAAQGEKGNGEESQLSGNESVLEDRIAAAPKTVWEVGADGETMLPQGGDVRQHSIGDCSFLAAIISMTPLHGAAVQDMIEGPVNGLYHVTFPNGDCVDVAPPTDGELARGASAGDNGLWMAILEKAYGVWRIAHDPTRSGAQTPLQAADGGDALDAVNALLSSDGKSSRQMLSSTPADEVAKALEAAYNEGRTITACIDADPNHKRNEGLPTDHAYGVLAFDAPGRALTLQNPWGHAEHKDATGQLPDGTDDGVFVLSLADFMRLFTEVSYSGATPEGAGTTTSTTTSTTTASSET